MIKYMCLSEFDKRKILVFMDWEIEAANFDFAVYEIRWWICESFWWFMEI